MSTTTPRAELGTASAIFWPVDAATEMSSSPVRRATTTSSRLLDINLSQVAQEASPPRCPSRRLRLTVVPFSPGCTATVSISVRIRSSPLPWSSSRSERQLPRSCTAISITVPSRWPDTSNRAPFVVPACSIAFVAASPHAVVISAISRSSRAGVRQPAAQHAADRRERLRLGGELGAELLRHREVEERQERHVVRRAPGRDQRGEEVVEQALRVVRAVAHRRPQLLEASVEVLAGPLDEPVGVEQQRVAGVEPRGDLLVRGERQHPERHGPRPSRKRGSPRDITSGGGRPAFTQRTVLAAGSTTR